MEANRTPIWSDPKEADASVQMIADKVRDVVEKMIRATVAIYRANIYRKQDHPDMTGTMYLIKVDIGVPTNYLHMEVYVPHDSESSESILLSVVENYKSKDTLDSLV
ncbi:leukocyte cysteine proteinase inhibitor 1-like [Hemitrygon akajei]|uniref:leukocyte cysteine proteinase inhibitor 1-like n=1 Tax=Hemitrygon akajei TaxID=2704970 RepID=UPI003BFA17CE